MHKCFFIVFCKFFKYPSPEAYASPSPSRGEGSGLLRCARNDGEEMHRPWCNKILGTRPSMTGARGADFVRLLRRCTPRNDAERNNIAFKGLDVVRQYASKFFETAESGVDKVVSSCEKNPSVRWMYMNFLRQRKTPLNAPLYAVSAGRSMIEMLGVLAIIAVLTVGGIAGYSKAMEKFKVDKAIGEYSQLIIGLMEHKNSLSKLDANQDYGTDLADFVEAANLVPQSWKKVDSLGFNDAYGNRIHTYTNNSKDIAIDFYLGGYEENEDSKRVSKAFNTKVCEEIFNNMAKPLQSSLKKAWLWGTKVEFYGNSYCCPNCKCLNKLTLSEIHQACNSCIKDTFCAIVFWF